MDQVEFMVWFALSKPYSFKFFKGCLPQIFLGPFLNTWYHLVPMSIFMKHKRSYKAWWKLLLSSLKTFFDTATFDTTFTCHKDPRICKLLSICNRKKYYKRTAWLFAVFFISHFLENWRSLIFLKKSHSMMF